MDSVPTGEDAAPVLCQKRYGAFKIRDVPRPTTHTIFFLNSGCKAVSKRQEVAIYEAEQTGSMVLSQAQVRIMLVAVIAIAIRVCLAKRFKTRKAARKRRTSINKDDEMTEEGGYSSGYSSSDGLSSRESSVHSFRELLLASLDMECSDEDTATTGSSFADRMGLSLTTSRLLYKSARRRANNGGFSEELDRGTVAEGTPTYLPHPTLIPASQKARNDDQEFLLCVKDLRKDLEKKTTRSQLVKGKREPPGIPPEW